MFHRSQRSEIRRQQIVAERQPAFTFFTLNAILGSLVLGFIIAGLR